jgi:hypothetical protein
MIRFWPDNSVSVETEDDLALLLKHAPHLLTRPRQEIEPEPVQRREPVSRAVQSNGHAPAKRATAQPHEEKVNRVVQVLRQIKSAGDAGIGVAKLAKHVGLKPLGLNGVVMKVSIDSKSIGIDRNQVYTRTMDKGRRSTYHAGPKIQQMIDHYAKQQELVLN